MLLSSGQFAPVLLEVGRPLNHAHKPALRLGCTRYVGLPARRSTPQYPPLRGSATWGSDATDPGWSRRP